MHAEIHRDGAGYLRAAAEFHRDVTLSREFLRGVAGDDDRIHTPPRGFLLVRRDDGRAVAAACRTSPDAGAISELPAELDAAADAASVAIAAMIRPGGLAPVQRLFGPEATLSVLARILEQADVRTQTEMRLIGHRLGVLQPPSAGPGELETLGVEHLDLMCEWADGFAAETGVPGGADTPEGIRRRLEAGRLLGWRAGGGVVAAVSLSRRTPATQTIGFVWTPPSHRCAGHASRLVAATCRRILDDGRRPVLFTNAADPGPNRLYDRLGFEAVGSFRSLAID